MRKMKPYVNGVNGCYVLGEEGEEEGDAGEQQGHWQRCP